MAPPPLLPICNVVSMVPESSASRAWRTMLCRSVCMASTSPESKLWNRVSSSGMGRNVIRSR